MNHQNNEEIIKLLEKINTLISHDKEKILIDFKLGTLIINIKISQKIDFNSIDIIHAITNKIFNLLSIYQKIFVLTDLWKHNPNKLNSSLWRIYISTDLENFFYNFRSIFDLVNYLIIQNADFPAKIPNKPKKSFNKLCTWLTQSKSQEGEAIRQKKQEENKKILGERMTKIIMETKDDFHKIKFVRDKFSHEKAGTLVFGEPSEVILCNFYELLEKAHFFEHEFYLEGKNKLINFNLFGAFYLSTLFDFLDELALIMAYKLGFKQIFEVPLHVSGSEFFEKYNKQLLDKLNK